MRYSVLCVDDDLGILEGYRRVLGRRWEVFLARGARQGIEKLEGGPDFAVVVTDMRMPEMNGIEFLQHVRRACPDAQRIILSGDSEQSTAIQAVNVGQVSAFLSKPCPAAALVAAVEEACARWSEGRERSMGASGARNAALTGLVRMLGAGDRRLRARGERVRDLCRSLLELRGQSLDWAVEAAALLSPAGLLCTPPSLRGKIEAGKALCLAEEELYEAAGADAAAIVDGLPGFGEVGEALRWQRIPFESAGPGRAPSGSALPLASRLIRLTSDLDWFAGAGGVVPVVARLQARAASYDPEWLALVPKIGVVNRSAGPADVPAVMMAALGAA
jgi:CheY-like chemotaxis protein